MEAGYGRETDLISLFSHKKALETIDDEQV